MTIDGVGEVSSQIGIDTEIIAGASTELSTETSARIGIERSGEDALVSGLLAAVLSPIELEGSTCSVPVVFREGDLILDESWPCDTTDTFDFTNNIFKRGTIEQELTVVDLVIEPGRGDHSLEATGTIEIDRTQEFHTEDQVQRSFFVSELSISFLGRHAARE